MHCYYGCSKCVSDISIINILDALNNNCIAITDAMNILNITNNNKYIAIIDGINSTDIVNISGAYL